MSPIYLLERHTPQTKISLYLFQTMDEDSQNKLCRKDSTLLRIYLKEMKISLCMKKYFSETGNLHSGACFEK